MRSNLAVQITGDKIKKGVPIEVLEAKENIKATMQIQASKGISEAEWILKHL